MSRMKDYRRQEMQYEDIRVCADCGKACEEKMASGGGRILHKECAEKREKRILAMQAKYNSTSLHEKSAAVLPSSKIWAEFHAREESGNL